MDGVRLQWNRTAGHINKGRLITTISPRHVGHINN